MEPLDIRRKFTEAGGRFLTDPEQIGHRLMSVRSLIFDWDGVFNDGTKVIENSSLFSEVDSMGVNMLRFSIYHRTGSLPYCFIVTGAGNPIVKKFASRERIHGVYLQSKNKAAILDHINSTCGLEDSDHAFFFDDILDLNAAERVAVRCQISRRSEPLMADFIENNHLADYRTGNSGGQGGLREACELLMGLGGTYDELIRLRMKYHGRYSEYFQLRQQVIPSFYEYREDEVHPLESN